jgi:ankyrin repeat protein
MLSCSNSPLLVLLQFVDPNVLSGDDHDALEEGEERTLFFHDVSDLADPFGYSTHENQLILAKQIEHGAIVNAVSSPCGKTPLHHACNTGIVTNLDFVELLLKEGADPNAQDHLGLTPLMFTLPGAPGAAKFLLSWPAPNVNSTSRSGASFLAKVRATVEEFSDKVVRPDNPDMVPHQFLLQQWREIEEMLVERGAADTGITTLE